ncbi:molybdopterin-dependent oxidoreductase [Rhodococcus koreensis]
MTALPRVRCGGPRCVRGWTLFVRGRRRDRRAVARSSRISSARSARCERSLAVAAARDSDALLAYAMNGERLPVQHGYPVRLIVPGWYGVASVKWLTEIEAVDRRFDGFFQADRYFSEWTRDGKQVKEPVTLQRVRALITEPNHEQHVEFGDLTVRGVAWSGAAPIARVDVSVDGGPWQAARLVGSRYRHGWQR